MILNLKATITEIQSPVALVRTIKYQYLTKALSDFIPYKWTLDMLDTYQS